MENVAADVLSRQTEGAECFGITVVQPRWVAEVLESYENDTEVQALIAHLSIQPTGNLEVTLQQGILCHQGRIWVGSNSQLRHKLVSEFHTSSWGGHSAANGIY